jgi:hypothetical protein
VAERLELSSFLGGGGRLGAGRREKVCIIGSGNWGSVIAKIVAENVVNGEHSSLFERDVPMWVFEEYVNGEKLSEIVNAKHENIKYLPGIKLPDNVFAVSDVGEAARDATILVFGLIVRFVFQFLPSVLPRIRENMRKVPMPLPSPAASENLLRKMMLDFSTILAGCNCCLPHQGR